MLVLRLDVVVVYVVIVDYVCHIGASASCKLATHLVGRRGHKRRLAANLSSSIGKVRTIVDMSGQLLRRALLTCK